jgi:hypothetical protein
MTQLTLQRRATHVRISALALISAPLIVGVALLLTAGQPALLPVLLGAAGWLAALVLRQPVAILASRLTSQANAARIVGWSSGPAEEIVRLALVLLALRTFHDAVWAGYGWATIEILVVAVNTLAVASLMTKNDPRSQQAREILEAQGTLNEHHPLWGLLERLGASALHLGFTFLLFVQPWLVLLTIPAHSLTNVLVVRIAKRNAAKAQTVLTIVALTVLTVGLVAVAL